MSWILAGIGIYIGICLAPLVIMAGVWLAVIVVPVGIVVLLWMWHPAAAFLAVAGFFALCVAHEQLGIWRMRHRPASESGEDKEDDYVPLPDFPW